MDRQLSSGIRFGREVCGELEQAERREWWLTNRNGAYAAGTLAGTLTRRYHGLLVAPLTPPLGRFLVLAKADATLWYNALRSMAAFARIVGDDPAPYQALAERAAASFRRFQRPDGQGLYDLIDGPEGDDASIRPNQILAVSLRHSPLTPEQQRRVVAECGRELLTSHGLRSLSPSHPDYRPHYLGDVWSRDGSYHQGPVWGWLLGHYALAEYRVSDDAQLALSRLEPMADHLKDAALGTVSEIFDGAQPHRPRGAPAQAWSVACTLDAWWRLHSAGNGEVIFAGNE